MRMGGGPQQFGVDAECVPGAARRPWLGATSTSLGFHVFAGSQNLHAEILGEAQRKTVELVLSTCRSRTAAGPVRQPRRRVRHPVLRQGRALDLAAVGANLAELMTHDAASAAARGPCR